MMTSGSGVHYSSMLDAGRKIVAAEGVASMFKGAGANVSLLRCQVFERELNHPFNHRSSVVSPVPVSCPCTTSFKSCSSARSTAVDLVKRPTRPKRTSRDRQCRYVYFLSESFSCNLHTRDPPFRATQSASIDLFSSDELSSCRPTILAWLLRDCANLLSLFLSARRPRSDLAFCLLKFVSCPLFTAV